MPLGLLSGPPGVGKSTVCRRVAEALAQSGNTVGGVVTEPAGRQRYAVDLASETRRLLASEEDPLPGPRWGPFSFSQETLEWGNHVVVRAIEAGFDLVVLDEVGPLELLCGAGFLPALRAILAAPQAALIVVRPGLLKPVSEMAARPQTIWTVCTENRDRLPDEIVRWLQGLPDRSPNPLNQAS